MATLLSAQPAVALVDVSRPDGMSVLELGSHCAAARPCGGCIRNTSGASPSARLCPPNLRDLTHIAAKSTALVSWQNNRRLACVN